MLSMNCAAKRSLCVVLVAILSTFLSINLVQARAPELKAAFSGIERDLFYYGVVVDPGEKILVKFQVNNEASEISADIYQSNPDGSVAVFGGWNNRNTSADNVDWGLENNSGQSQTFYLGSAHLSGGWKPLMPITMERGTAKQVVRFHYPFEVLNPLGNASAKIAGQFANAEMTVVVERIVPFAKAPETEALRKDLAADVIKQSGVFAAIEAKLTDFDLRLKAMEKAAASPAHAQAIAEMAKQVQSLREEVEAKLGVGGEPPKLPLESK